MPFFQLLRGSNILTLFAAVDLNSVERVVEYLDLPQEPPAIIESNPVPAYWPSSSSSQMLVVDNLVIRYAPDLPAVLQGISFTLNPKERVGLLGRTGSGKSTLAMALLRFVDPTEGRIMIGGLDISKIGLHDLRSRVVRVCSRPCPMIPDFSLGRQSYPRMRFCSLGLSGTHCNISISM